MKAWPRRPDSGRTGTIAPRNNLVGDPIHRIDVRAQHRTRLGVHAHGGCAVEVYNLFNRANYGTYTTQESNAQSGCHRSTTTSRSDRDRCNWGLGFRFAF